MADLTLSGDMVASVDRLADGGIKVTLTADCTRKQFNVSDPNDDDGGEEESED